MRICSYPAFSIANVLDRLINRRFAVPKHIDKNVKIFVFQHFKVDLPECFADKSVYVPISGGSCECADILRDNTPPSISEYNAYLNEMTQIYWVANHYIELGNPAYVGFAHYRRCLDWNPAMLMPNVLFASKFVSRKTNRDFFIDCHGSLWLDSFLARFAMTIDPEEYGDIDRYWNSRVMYIANNFITDRETFFRYFRFADVCLSVCRALLDQNIDIFKKMTKSDKRQFSYIMERMTGYWIWHENRVGHIKIISSRLRCYEIDNGLSAVR